MAYFRYYRALLTKEEQSAYDKLAEGLKKMESKISLPLFPVESLDRIVMAINYDYPEFFFVDYSNFVLEHGKNIRIMEAAYFYSKEKKEALHKEIRKKANAIIKLTRGMSFAEAASFLHDYFVRYCTYGTIKTRQMDAHNIAGPLLDKKCVCEGYAKVYKYLADAVRLPCLVVVGSAIHADGSDRGHAWNMIDLTGRYYHVDVTNDAWIGGQYCSKAYYALSTKEISNNHRVDKQFRVPDCSVSGSPLRLVSNVQELVNLLKKDARDGARFTEVRLSKGIEGEELIEKISKMITWRDRFWFSKVGEYWYGEGKCKSLCVCWK